MAILMSPQFQKEREDKFLAKLVDPAKREKMLRNLRILCSICYWLMVAWIFLMIFVGGKNADLLRFLLIFLVLLQTISALWIYLIRIYEAAILPRNK